MKQLLIETQTFQPTSTESLGGKLIVAGVFQRANAPNQNGRIYTKPILEKGVQQLLVNAIRPRTTEAIGELDHPEASVVNLQNGSHIILDLWWEGDDLMGKLEVLNTPAGNILRALLEANIKVGISSRGMGSVSQIHESDLVQIEDDFVLITWDIVSTPSTHGAFIRPVNESKVIMTVEEKDNKINVLMRDIICELTGTCCLLN